MKGLPMAKKPHEGQDIGKWLSGMARLAAGLDDDEETGGKAKGMNPADVLVPPDQLASIFRIDADEPRHNGGQPRTATGKQR